MMATLTDLIIEETKATIYAFALTIADATGLETTTWRPGDPTRSLYHVVSEKLASWESVTAAFVRAAFLDYATGDMLRIHAYQQFGYTAEAATFGACSCTLTNASGAVYSFDAGDITAKNTASGATYRNTTGGTLDALGTLSLTFTAEEAGSDSNAAIGEIDDLVTAYLGVTIANATACIGSDEESDASIRTGCRAKLGSLSAAGPAKAYEYVALASELTGDTESTRVRVYPDSDTGEVTIILAADAGAVSGTAVTAVEAAIVEWAAPLTITPLVQSASEVSIAVTYTIWIYDRVSATSSEVDDAIAAALATAFAERPIGGDIIPPATTGKIYADKIRAVIESVYPADTFRVSMSAPASDTSLATDEVATLGTVTATVNLIASP
jgi:phage-related baseplate assembly protein